MTKLQSILNKMLQWDRFNENPDMVFQEEPERYPEQQAEADIERLIKEEKHEAWVSLDQGATCCKDKHQTFYGAIVNSPQWKAWEAHQRQKPTRDMAEVMELGVMSDGHFQEFLEFIESQLHKGGNE